MEFLQGNHDYLVFAAIAIGAQWTLGAFLSRRGARISWLSWALLLAALLGGFPFVEGAERRAHARVRGMMIGYATTYAAEMENLGHARLGSNPAADDPLYLALIEAAIRWQEANQAIADVYTMRRKGDGTIFFLVDSETDYNKDGDYADDRENRTPPGEPFEKNTDDLLSAFDGASTFSDRPYEDKWGVWLSANTPLRDADGKVEAVIAVDFPAEAWKGAVARARGAVIGALGALILTLGGGGAVAAILRARVKESQAAAERSVADAQALEAANRSLTEAMRKAEAASHAKSGFLATMSHELRTPLNGIVGMAQALAGTELDADQRECTATIKKSADWLLAIINDILDISKIEAGKLEIEPIPFDIRSLLEEVASLGGVRAHEKGLALLVEIGDGIPRRMIGDPGRLRQMALNLVSNAVKFTERGEVRVRADVMERSEEGARVRISVADTGIGIPAERQGELFNRFVQVDASRTRRFGGTGLGLAIVKELALLMGGAVGLASEPGEGSTFWFEVPLKVDGSAGEEAAAASAAQASPSPSPKPAAARRALIAEDNEVNQRVAERLLERLGCASEIAANGAEAVGLAAQGGYDLIFMDCMMPEMDGYEATAAIRRAEAAAGAGRMPIIAMTAGVADSDRTKCLEAGMDDFLAKPISMDELRATLERWAPR